MGRLDGKGALVSGGARGIGAAIGSRLAAEGDGVDVGDILEESEFEVADGLGASGGVPAAGCHQQPGLDRRGPAAVGRFGGQDIMVNNAAIELRTHRRLLDGAVGQCTGGETHRHVPGHYRRCSWAQEARGGSIICISSIAGIRGYEKLPGYTASKFGVRGLSKAAALDLGRDRIRVNSVHPGFILTPMTEGLVPSTSQVAGGGG